MLEERTLVRILSDPREPVHPLTDGWAFSFILINIKRHKCVDPHTPICNFAYAVSSVVVCARIYDTCLYSGSACVLTVEASCAGLWII